MSDYSETALNRAERRRVETRARLLEATADLLATVGYTRLSVRAIAERADVGNGTFYLHFTDKDDAVWALMEAALTAATAESAARLAQIPSPQREYVGWLELFMAIEAQRELTVSLFGRRGSPVLAARYLDYLAALHTANLQAGRFLKSADVPDEVLAQVAAGATLRLILWWLETRSAYSPTEMAAMLFTAVYRTPPPKMD